MMFSLFFFGVPILCMLAILSGKTVRVWRPWLAQQSRMTQLLAVLAFGLVILYGGGKTPPGPTIANLKLLIARNNGQLSNGQEYARKSDFAIAKNQIDTINNHFVDVTNTLAAVAVADTNTLAHASDKHGGFFRLNPGSTIHEGNRLSASIVDYSVSNYVATVAVWFSVEPSEAPQIVLNYCLGTSTNHVLSAYPTSCSYPNSVAYGDFDCYEYTVDVPESFCDDNGNLIAPLNFERELAFGNPQTGDRFDLKGQLAIARNGKYYKAYTGTKTNGTTIIHFYGGKVYNPQSRSPLPMEDHND